MTGRSLSFALTRARVAVPAALGVVSLSAGWTTLAIIMLVVASVKLSRVLSHTDIDLRLRLRDTKRRYGISRGLFRGEQREILALQQYSQRLRKSGAQGTLATETMDAAWRIIANGGAQNATEHLKRLKQSLPSISGPSGAQGKLADRIEQELHLLRAAQREVDNVV